MTATRSGWVVLLLAGLGFWLAFFHRMVPAAISGELTREFGVTGAALGALAATYFFVYTLMQLPTGVLVDTLGPRRVLTAGGIIAGIGSLIFGAADSVAAAAAGRLLSGLGVSVAFVSMLKFTANWFPERNFSTAAGIGNVIGLTGALAATVPLAWMITVVPWRGVFTVVGCASLALAGLTWWVVRDQPRDAPPPPPRASGARWHDDLIAIMRNRATWPPFWVTFGLSGTYMCFVSLWVGPVLMEVYGYSAVAASRHTAVMVVALAVSSSLIGLLSDRLQFRRPLIISSSALAVCCWTAWFIGVPHAWTYALCAATGFLVTGFTLCWGAAKEVNPRHHAGMATSLANTGGFLAAGMLQPVVGGVFDFGRAQGLGVAQSFQAALGVLALFSVIGLAGAWFIRETRCRNIWDSEISRAQR